MAVVVAAARLSLPVPGHAHRAEELYVVVGGSGRMQLDADHESGSAARLDDRPTGAPVCLVRSSHLRRRGIRRRRLGSIVKSAAAVVAIVAVGFACLASGVFAASKPPVGFSVLSQPVDTSHDAILPAEFRGVSRTVTQKDGTVAFVSPVGDKLWLSYGSSFMPASFAKAVRGRLGFTSLVGQTIRLVQMVPDGIDHIVLKGKKVPVVQNVVVVTTSERTAEKYLRNAATAKGKKAFGYKKS